MEKPFLRAADEATMTAALLMAGLLIQDVQTDDEGDETPIGNPYPALGVELNIIGEYSEIDNSDPDNPVAVPVSGYHVNAVLRTDRHPDLADALPLLAGVLVDPPPATPYRKYPD